MGIFDRKPNVEKLAARQDVKGLIEALKYKEDKVRRDAVDALAKIGATAVEPLIEALKDEDGHARWYAAKTLGKIKDSRAVGPLIQALKDREWTVRKDTAEALGEIGDTRAVEPIIEALKDRNVDVQSRAAFALGKFGDTRAVEPLIQALKSEVMFVRAGAAESLGKIGDVRAVEPLMRALNDGSFAVSLHAKESLNQIKAKNPLVKIEKLVIEPFQGMKLIKIYTVLFRRQISPQEYAERAKQALGIEAGAQVVGTLPGDETLAKHAIREVCGDIWSRSPIPEVKIERGNPADFDACHNPALQGGGLNDYAIDLLKRKIAEGKDPDYFNIAGYRVYVTTSVDRITGDAALVIHIYE